MSTNQRYLQAQVASNSTVREAVEAAVMKIAQDVIYESPDIHGHESRRAIAENLYRGADVERLVRLFVWRAVNNPQFMSEVMVDGQVDAAGIDDGTIDGIVSGGWNLAAGVKPEG